MGWFRTLLKEKAEFFQIIVFTCRPGDYLPQAARVPDGSAVHADMDGGLIRAIDIKEGIAPALDVKELVTGWVATEWTGPQIWDTENRDPPILSRQL